MRLPADSHVHSEWSWDTGGPRSQAVGTMRATCAQAVKFGLPALYFTEHLDIPDTWRVQTQDAMPHQAELINAAGRFEFEPFDAEGYFEAIDRMRFEFPDVHIGTGVEFGQPHLNGEQAARIVDLDQIDRVIGSLHTLDLGNGHAEPALLFREHDPALVIREYLAQVPVMVQGSDAFEVFTHIDYALRSWPSNRVGPFDPRDFEEPFRVAFRAIAQGDRALEMNTRRLWPWIPQWWAQEGGMRVSFASDAHTTDALAANFPEAAVMVERFGFREGRSAQDLWSRSLVV